MELRRKLWDGLLPVKVDLALSDLNKFETPRPLYVSLLRLRLRLMIDYGSKRELPLLYSDRGKVAV